jgi:hypothetical protein
VIQDSTAEAGFKRIIGQKDSHWRAGLRCVVGGPELGDVDAAAEPHSWMAFYIFQKTFENFRQSGPAAGEVMHGIAILHRLRRALFVVRGEFIFELLQSAG